MLGLGGLDREVLRLVETPVREEGGILADLALRLFRAQRDAAPPRLEEEELLADESLEHLAAHQGHVFGRERPGLLLVVLLGHPEPLLERRARDGTPPTVATAFDEEAVLLAAGLRAAGFGLVACAHAPPTTTAATPNDSTILVTRILTTYPP